MKFLAPRIKAFFGSDTFKKPLFVFLITRIPLFILSFLTLSTLGLSPNYRYYSAFPAYVSTNKAFEGFMRWDASWYVNIAQKGYSYQPGGMSNIAFFPLYPALMRLVSVFTGDYYLAGFLISNLAFFAALIAIFRLVKNKFDAETAFKTILLISVFPFSFFFSSVYTEPLFLLAAAIFFLALEKSQYLRAGIATAVASLVHIQGVFFILILDLTLWRFKKIQPVTVLATFISFLGISAFIAFNQIKFGEPLAFVNAQTQGWFRSFDFTFREHTRVVATILGLQPLKYGVFDILKIFNLVLAVFWLLLLPRIQKLLGTAYSVFTVLNVGLPFINSLWSLERFVLVAFPGFIVLAATKRKMFYNSVLILSIFFLGFWSILFFAGFPVQ